MRAIRPIGTVSQKEVPAMRIVPVGLDGGERKAQGKHERRRTMSSRDVVTFEPVRWSEAQQASTHVMEMTDERMGTRRQRRCTSGRS